MLFFNFSFMSLLWFKRYDAEKFDQIREIPDVVDVVPGKDMDIVVLKKQGNTFLQDAIQKIKSDMEVRGVNIEQLGFMYAGEKTVYNPKPTEHGGAGKYVSLGEIGIDALHKLWITTKDKIGDILPPNFQSVNTFSAPDLVEFMEKIRSFGLKPGDLVVWAKFKITTKSSKSASTYILTINEQGLFEIKDDEINLAKPKMIGSTFRDFNNVWQLVWDGGQTSPVQTMEKV